MTKKKMSPKTLIAICSAIYFVSYFTRKNFAAVMAGMIEIGVINKEMGGYIGMALFITYGIGQVVSGFLGDKIKPQLLLALGLGATTVSNLLMPVANGSAFTIALWGINGFAQAMLWPPIVKLLSSNLDNETYVKANLIVTSAAHVATILLYLYVPLCLLVFDWQTVFYSASAIAAIALTAFIILLSLTVINGEKAQTKKPTTTFDNAQNAPKTATVIYKSGLIPIFLAIIAMGFLRDGIESWLPTLYCEVFETQASESILVSVVLPIFSILAISSVTALHKRPLFNNEMQGSLTLFIASAALAGALAITLCFKEPVFRVISLILAALVCACMHGINFLLISCVPARFVKTGRTSTIGGLCNACTYIGAAISMYGIPLVSNTLGWIATVISWLILAIIGATASISSFRKFTTFISKENQQ